MGVSGYDLLALATGKNMTAVMLTAHALTPENIVKSYREGAAYFLPKEEMVNITSFLEEILEAKQKRKRHLGQLDESAGRLLRTHIWRQVAGHRKRFLGPIPLLLII